MPPKAAKKPKLHELAIQVPPKTVIDDPAKKKKYVLGEHFATGGFGRIYRCHEEGNAKTTLVIKMEPHANGPLFTEITVFQRILKKELINEFMQRKKISWIGLPWVISSGFFTYKTEKLRFLIMPSYVSSLEAYRAQNKTIPPLKAWNVAQSMSLCLEYIHDKDYTHADIKAGNILFEQKDNFAKTVLVDFGLARLSASNKDVPDKKRAHNGTAIFTSMDAHRGCHPSYRGDVEILAFNLMYWITGTLPWLADEENAQKVYEKKTTFLADVKKNLASHMKSYPQAAKHVGDMFQLVKSTNYVDKVDFNKLNAIIKKALSEPDSSSSASSGSKKRASDSDVTTESPIKQPSAKKKPAAVKSTRPAPKARKALPLSPLQIESSPEQIPVRRVRAPPAVVSPPSTDRRRPTVPRVVRSPRTPVKEASDDDDSIVVLSSPSISPSPQKKSAKMMSNLKANPTELRKQVPGLMNMKKGRRSLVIKKITKKYEKMAARKNAASPE